MNIFKLFLEFFKIGAFSFGGGMSTLPYIYEMSRRTLWIDENSITNILTVSQITPGPLACNIGTIVGIKVNGVFGSIIANIAFVIPAIVFIGIGYKLYNKVQNNNTANEVIKIVRSAALAIVITSSITIFKNAFLNETEIINLKNILFIINFRSIVLGFLIYFLEKNKRINSLLLILISSIVAVIFKV